MKTIFLWLRRIHAHLRTRFKTSRPSKLWVWRGANLIRGHLVKPVGHGLDHVPSPNQRWMSRVYLDRLQTGAGPGRGRAPFEQAPHAHIVRALVCRLRCLPEGTTFRITLITQCGSAVRLRRRPYGLHRQLSFACGRQGIGLWGRRPSVDLQLLPIKILIPDSWFLLISTWFLWHQVISEQWTPLLYLTLRFSVGTSGGYSYRKRHVSVL